MDIVDKTETSIQIHYGGTYITIRFYRKDIIRITCATTNNFTPRESISVIAKPSYLEWSLETSHSNENPVMISTASLLVQVNPANARIQIFTKDRIVLFQEPENHPPEITPQSIMGENTNSIKQYIQLKPEESVYGLGQHQDVQNRLNFRGTTVDLYQANLKIPVPVLISSRGYGILWDNYSYTQFQDSEAGTYLWSEVGDAVDYYVIYGPSIDQTISGVRFLTGQCPLLPKWAFGYVQSKERYKTGDELVEIVKEYRKREIPIDVIVQDWRYWGNLLYWGQKSFDKKRYPNPTATINALHALNAKIMISIWPILQSYATDYKELKKRGFLFHNSFRAVYNAFNPDARELYWQQARDGLFIHGIDAWWCDSTEPVEYVFLKENATWNQVRDVQIAILKKCLCPGIGSAARFLNAYPLMQSRGIYEHQRRDSPKRVVNLTRAGYTGQHRYSTIVWSGDISSRWDVFAAQIPAALNYCIAGSPYWTVDIGGFFPHKWPFVFNAKGDFSKDIKDLGFRELYLRWFQFGAFLPMFRAHGTSTPREVWRFGEPGSVFFDTLVKYIHLRYRLLPYIYSVAWMVTVHDYSMMRALVFDFVSDPKVKNINDEYLFGPYLLVCPVLSPMYYGQKSEVLKDIPKIRKVYLPAGVRWYDFWTNHVFSGGVEIEADAPLESMPLFVKGGSILPLGPKKQYATQPEDPLEIRIYPGSDAEFLLYEDENDTYHYETGMFSTILFSWKDSPRLFQIGSRQGTFPGMLETRTFRISIVNEKCAFGFEEIKEGVEIIEYNGKALELKM